MNWNVVSFSFGSKIYSEYQQFLNKNLSEQGLKCFSYNVDDLKETKEYKNNPDYFILDTKYGWCSWKAIFALKAMESLEDGEMLMICDVDDVVHPDIFKYVEETMGDDPCLLMIGGEQMRRVTKRDCFVFMDCDDEDYWNAPQLEVGITFWKVCDQSKSILKEWLKWCLDERVNGDNTNYCGKPDYPEFRNWCGKDQSILTLLAVRDGLSVDGGYIRNYLECNVDFWYERYLDGRIQPYRIIEKYLVDILESNPYSQVEHTHSIILNVHNKEWLIDKVLESIINNTVGKYEIIVVIDGCSDNSESVVRNILSKTNISYKIINTPNIFETKANNVGIKEASGDYVTLIQDDIIIQEHAWNMRMKKPFVKFDNVFAVSANYSHNYVFNENSRHVGMKEDLDNCWSDILISVDQASIRNIPRDTFAIRSTVNRGPLMINREDLEKMKDPVTGNYFDEEFYPADMDDHDLMYRMYKKLGKIVGCYWINFLEDPTWGGTRDKVTGQPRRWILKSNQKNTKLFYERHKDILNDRRIVRDVKVS